MMRGYTDDADKQDERSTDWWKEINEEEKNEIIGGLTQTDKGDVLSHEEVMSSYQKWR
jgi:predicted transcriptional regulator